MSKITLPELRRLINEELSANDYSSVRDVVTGASKLLEAIADFRESSTTAMTNAVASCLDDLAKHLENMIDAPRSYVDKVRPEPKVVSLRPTKK